MYGEIKTEILANYAKRGKIISEKSVDKYLNDIRKIQSLLGDLGQIDDISFLYRFNDVRSVVENLRGRKIDPNSGEKVMASDNTKRNYYQSVVSVFDALGDYKAIAYYQKVVNSYNKDYKDKSLKASLILTPESEEKLISFDELTHIVNTLQLKSRDIKEKLKSVDHEYSNEEMNDFQMFILLKLYMKHPARNEFGTLIFSTKIRADKDQESKLNHLVIQHKKDGESYLHINDYKTAGLYDTRIIELDSEMAGLFRIWRTLLRMRSTQDQGTIGHGHFLGKSVFYSRFFDIPNDSRWFDAPMTSNKLSKYFAKFFDKCVSKNLSTTAIAKIVTSNRNKQHVDALKKTSNDRGTSVGTLSQVYTPVLPS